MTTTELISVEVLVSPARVAVAGFLAGYSGRTRDPGSAVDGHMSRVGGADMLVRGLEGF